MTGTWTLLARAPDLTPLGILHAATLQLQLRLNEVGSWRLTIPRETTPAGWPAPGAGLICLRNSSPVASGMIDELGYDWSADPATDTGMWTLTGDTDLGRLAYRLIYPTPARPWGGQTATHFRHPQQGTDTGEEVLRVTVNHQAGSLAPPYRRVPGLRLGTPTGAGDQVRITERFSPLLDGLRKIAAAAGGLSFDVTDALTGAIEFTVRAPRDRTRTARFGTELGNLTALQVRQIAPVATTALVAGQGEGTGRELVEIPDNRADPAWDRRETLIDQRHVPADDPWSQRHAEYRKAARQALADAGERTAITATITDTATTAWQRDYHLGDRVAINTPVGPLTDLIRALDITVDATGEEHITTTIGDPDPASDNPHAATIRNLTDRINQLERGR